MAYTYLPGSPEDVVLQAWVLEEPGVLKLRKPEDGSRCSTPSTTSGESSAKGAAPAARACAWRRPAEKLGVASVVCPGCFGPMCWLCGKAGPAPPRGRHRCESVRVEFASYEHCSQCYQGGYIVCDGADDSG